MYSNGQKKNSMRILNIKIISFADVGDASIGVSMSYDTSYVAIYS